MTTIRLLLGDQLHHGHSWFQHKNDNVIYLMAEMQQEATYVTHHIQKLLAFFAAMRNFADYLEKEGHRVHYISISDPIHQKSLSEIITHVVQEYKAQQFEYLLPDEYRLDRELKALCKNLDIPVNARDTEHFLTTRTTLKDFFGSSKQLLMERFYRMMREKHNILLDEKGDPLGGAWNFDKTNRKNWKGKPGIPPIPRFTHDLGKLPEEIEAAGIKSIGHFDPGDFNWPLNREQALIVLDHFCEVLLPFFGDFQDAMHTAERYLFHSRLSFALNVKLLTPAEVIARAEQSYRRDPQAIGISQAEGFIRQILGWREYMRGIYWKEMPAYEKKNHFGNSNKLPEFYWTGNTKMNCLQHSINNSLDNAYAHHIQRLMITGNFALLNQTDPDEADRWYLGIYIDAIQWVEITNTRGMSQYADGGLLATKPYISSANYINKMSNYCKSCSYDPKKRTGASACPFNALYWNFLDDKKKFLRSNPRMGMMYKLLEKIEPDELNAIKARSRQIMQNPDHF